MHQNNFRYPNMVRPYGFNNMNGDRFIGGGFLAPFLLGGITGGLLAPAFNRPYYGPIPYGPIPYGPVPVYPMPVYQNQYQIYY